MRYGACSWVFGDQALETTAAFLAEAGFDGVELSHLLNTAAQALEFVEAVGQSNVGILLDAYHMNIEEADPATAILDAGDRLFLFHAADSNRQAVGRGHTDFLALLRALRRSGYNGDVIVECTAVGPDPFTPIKGNGWRDEVRQHTTESLRLLRAYASLT